MIIEEIKSALFYAVEKRITLRGEEYKHMAHLAACARYTLEERGVTNLDDILREKFKDKWK